MCLWFSVFPSAGIGGMAGAYRRAEPYYHLVQACSAVTLPPGASSPSSFFHPTQWLIVECLADTDRTLRDVQTDRQALTLMPRNDVEIEWKNQPLK